MLQIIGILLSIILLIYLIYHKTHPVLCVIIVSLVAGISNGESIWDISDAFTVGTLSFMEPILILFILSSIYGKLMDKTKSAATIAAFVTDALGERFSILALILSTALLVYGGISVFTVVFCIAPIGISILKKADVPLVLLPAIFTIGQSTFAMTALPGSPQINNIIPAQYFGTTLMAAPVLGIICALIMLALSYLYIINIIGKMRKQNIGFDHSVLQLAEVVPTEKEDLLPIWKACFPVVMLLSAYFLLSRRIIPNQMDVYQSINTAMTVAIIFTLFLNLGQKNALKDAFQEGCAGWISPLIHLSIIIGFGSVVKSTEGFRKCVSLLLSLEMNPYISAAFCTAVVSGITGSASGGISIACNTFAPVWMQNANPQILHRICSIASCSLDSLPHSGGLYTTLEVFHVELRDAYPYVFVVTVVIPVIVTIIAVVMGNIGIY